MKKKIYLGLILFILSTIVVSCSSFGTKRVEEIPPVEVVVPIDDEDTAKFYDTFNDFKRWVSKTTNAAIPFGYYDRDNKSAEIKSSGTLTYDRTILRTINKREDINGTYRIYYILTASVKDGKIKISGKIWKSEWWKPNGSFEYIDISEDAFQLFIDHINYIASFFEN